MSAKVCYGKWISLVDYSPLFCAIIGSIATNRTRKIGVILTTLFPVFPRSPVITAHLIPPWQRSTYEKINHPRHNIPPHSAGWLDGLRASQGDDDDDDDDNGANDHDIRRLVAANLLWSLFERRKSLGQYQGGKLYEKSILEQCDNERRVAHHHGTFN